MTSRGPFRPKTFYDSMISKVEYPVTTCHPESMKGTVLALTADILYPCIGENSAGEETLVL